MDTINICIAFDNIYATPAQVLVTSVLSNSRDHDQLRIYILDNGIDKTTKTSFEKLTKIKDFDFNFINIDNKQFEHYHLPEHGHFSHVNYYRIIIPSLIPDVDKILYLDCDMIVQRSLTDLYEINISDFSIGAAKSVTSNKNNRRLDLPKFCPYINSGVLLINAKKWRQDGIETKIIDFIETAPEELLKNIEQDAINAVLTNSIYFIKRNWNVEFRSDITYPNYYKAYLDNPYIVHYVSTDKPWLGNTQQDRKLFYYYKRILDNVANP